jgi:glycosyltransferase involved in cell wall biosynthesis
MVRHLQAAGYFVRFDLGDDVDCIVVVDPRVGGNVGFGTGEIAAFRDRNPSVRCVHRVNENDLHRGGGTLDSQLAEINTVADYTVFVSDWVREYHVERWFDPAKPYCVIHNGADPAVYHPVGADALRPGESMRLVTHHWSDNVHKGFQVYAEIDRLIAEGELDGTELWIVGRWPSSLEWSAARTWPPRSGQELGDLLRRAHVYVTGALYEPGAMHVVEGAQCGLPFLYHEDGGGIVELVERFGIGFKDDVGGAVREMRRRYPELREAVLESTLSGDLMCARYRQVIQRLIVDQ